MKHISRAVWILSLISLFTDMASEMLYPIMPIYLKTIGFSIVLIGVLEGVAEAVAGLSKGYFGKRSDAAGKRVPFVQLGYTLSAISKPMLALFIYPAWVFFSRTIDRLGKGIRTGARDALLSDEATLETKGRVFGFHRSMDTLGAVLGPAAALIYLYFYPGQYKMLFLIAFLPGVLAIAATFFLKEKKILVTSPEKKIGFFSFLNYWKQSPAAYRKIVIGFLAFALINSSDVFLLLKAKEMGFTDSMVIMVYIFYNLVYALAAFPVGIMADKLGLNKIFIVGLCLFVVVYGGMSVNENIYLLFVLFAVYGLYASATEGIAKAWISNISAKEHTATAIGTYTGLQSICSMVASTVAGLIWFGFGSVVLFIGTAVAAAGVGIYFVFLGHRKPVPLL